MFAFFAGDEEDARELLIYDESRLDLPGDLDGEDLAEEIEGDLTGEGIDDFDGDAGGDCLTGDFVGDFFLPLAFAMISNPNVDFMIRKRRDWKERWMLNKNPEEE